MDKLRPFLQGAARGTVCAVVIPVSIEVGGASVERDIMAWVVGLLHLKFHARHVVLSLGGNILNVGFDRRIAASGEKIFPVGVLVDCLRKVFPALNNLVDRIAFDVRDVSLKIILQVAGFFVSVYVKRFCVNSI